MYVCLSFLPPWTSLGSYHEVSLQHDHGLTRHEMHWYNKPLVAVCLVLVAFVGYIIWAMHDELTFMIWCGLGSQNTFLKSQKKHQQHFLAQFMPMTNWQEFCQGLFFRKKRSEAIGQYLSKRLFVVFYYPSSTYDIHEQREYYEKRGGIEWHQLCQWFS